MDYTALFYSIATGISMGVVYGYLFIWQHTLPTDLTRSTLVRSSLFGALRLVSFATAWYFILKSPLLKSILVFILFFISFWTVILSVKGRR